MFTHSSSIYNLKLLYQDAYSWWSEHFGFVFIDFAYNFRQLLEKTNKEIALLKYNEAHLDTILSHKTPAAVSRPITPKSPITLSSRSTSPFHSSRNRSATLNVADRQHQQQDFVINLSEEEIQKMFAYFLLHLKKICLEAKIHGDFEDAALSLRRLIQKAHMLSIKSRYFNIIANEKTTPVQIPTNLPNIAKARKVQFQESKKNNATKTVVIEKSNFSDHDLTKVVNASTFSASDIYYRLRIFEQYLIYMRDYSLSPIDFGSTVYFEYDSYMSPSHEDILSKNQKNMGRSQKAKVKAESVGSAVHMDNVISNAQITEILSAMILEDESKHGELSSLNKLEIILLQLTFDRHVAFQNIRIWEKQCTLTMDTYRKSLNHNYIKQIKLTFNDKLSSILTIISQRYHKLKGTIFSSYGSLIHFLVLSWTYGTIDQLLSSDRYVMFLKELNSSASKSDSSVIELYNIAVCKTLIADRFGFIGFTWENKQEYLKICLFITRKFGKKCIALYNDALTSLKRASIMSKVEHHGNEKTVSFDRGIAQIKLRISLFYMRLSEYQKCQDTLVECMKLFDSCGDLKNYFLSHSLLLITKVFLTTSVQYYSLIAADFVQLRRAALHTFGKSLSFLIGQLLFSFALHTIYSNLDETEETIPNMHYDTLQPALFLLRISASIFLESSCIPSYVRVLKFMNLIFCKLNDKDIKREMKREKREMEDILVFHNIAHNNGPSPKKLCKFPSYLSAIYECMEQLKRYKKIGMGEYGKRLMGQFVGWMEKHRQFQSKRVTQVLALFSAYNNDFQKAYSLYSQYHSKVLEKQKRKEDHIQGMENSVLLDVLQQDMEFSKYHDLQTYVFFLLLIEKVELSLDEYVKFEKDIQYSEFDQLKIKMPLIKGRICHSTGNTKSAIYFSLLYLRNYITRIIGPNHHDYYIIPTFTLLWPALLFANDRRELALEMIDECMNNWIHYIYEFSVIRLEMGKSQLPPITVKKALSVIPKVIIRGKTMIGNHFVQNIIFSQLEEQGCDKKENKRHDKTSSRSPSFSVNSSISNDCSFENELKKVLQQLNSLSDEERSQKENITSDNDQECSIGEDGRPKKGLLEEVKDRLVTIDRLRNDNSKTAILVYTYYDGNIMMAAINSSGISVLETVSNVDVIEEERLILCFLKMCQQKQVKNRKASQRNYYSIGLPWNEIARRKTTKYLNPFSSILATHQRLIIISNGFLSYLPFHSLIFDEHNELPLMASHIVSYLPSLKYFVSSHPLYPTKVTNEAEKNGTDSPLKFDNDYKDTLGRTGSNPNAYIHAARNINLITEAVSRSSIRRRGFEKNETKFDINLFQLTTNDGMMICDPLSSERTTTPLSNSSKSENVSITKSQDALLDIGTISPLTPVNENISSKHFLDTSHIDFGSHSRPSTPQTIKDKHEKYLQQLQQVQSQHMHGVKAEHEEVLDIFKNYCSKMKDRLEEKIVLLKDSEASKKKLLSSMSSHKILHMICDSQWQRDGASDTREKVKNCPRYDFYNFPSPPLSSDHVLQYPHLKLHGDLKFSVTEWCKHYKERICGKFIILTNHHMYKYDLDPSMMEYDSDYSIEPHDLQHILLAFGADGVLLSYFPEQREDYRFNSLLMRHFYRNLLIYQDGKDPALALHNAVKAVCFSQANGPFNHPYYFGRFTYHGKV